MPYWRRRHWQLEWIERMVGQARRLEIVPSTADVTPDMAAAWLARRCEEDMNWNLVTDDKSLMVIIHVVPEDIQLALPLMDDYVDFYRRWDEFWVNLASVLRSSPQSGDLLSVICDMAGRRVE